MVTLARRRRFGRLVTEVRISRGARTEGLGDSQLRGVRQLPVGTGFVEKQATGADQDIGVRRQADQLGRAAGQLVDRQEGVTFLLGFRDREDRRGLGAPRRLGRDVGRQGDAVGAGEADPLDLREPVGVLVQDRHRAIAEAPVDRRRQMGQAVWGELDVEIADRPRGVPRVGGRGRLVCADTPQRAEDADRIGGDRAQHPLAVLVDQALGAGWADVPQRGQIGDPSLAVGGVERQGATGLQLPAVLRVRLPVPAHFGPVAGVQMGDRADQREALARVDLLHLEHRVAVVLGAKDHPQHLDRPGEGSRVGVEQGGCAVHAVKASGKNGGMGEAILFAVVASSALPLGALIAVWRPPPRAATAALLGFASGALITAVAFELFEKAFEHGGAWRAGIAFFAGATAFVLVDGWLERRKSRQQRAEGPSAWRCSPG